LIFPNPRLIRSWEIHRDGMRTASIGSPSGMPSIMTLKPRGWDGLEIDEEDEEDEEEEEDEEDEEEVDMMCVLMSSLKYFNLFLIEKN
jgi:hypothetical protein